MPVSEGRFPLTHLVQESFPTVSVVVAKLASQKVNRSLGELSGYLCSFGEEILHFSDEQKRNLERDGRIVELLAEVERAVSWRDGPFAGTGFPTLRAVAAAQRAAEEGSREAVASIAALESKMRASLVKKRIKSDIIVPLLQRCSEIRAEDELDDPESAVFTKDDLPGYAKHARIVHGVLCTYAACICQRSSAADRHWARLRLKPVQEYVDGSLVPFELLFSASPNPDEIHNYDWQGVQVLVPTKNASSRRVQFVEASSSANVQSQSSLIDAVAVEGSLCNFIASRCGSLLSFKVDHGRLMALHESEDLSREPKVRPDLGLHLGEVLGNFKMRHGMRPILAYILAKAVWHYYDSDWMSVGWTKHSIYFMSERDDEDEEAYFLKPYLTAQLAASTEKKSEYRQVVGMMHKYPRVLALGIMLTEIATGKPINIEGNPDDWNPRMANEQLTSLRNTLRGTNFEEDCRFPRYKAAVEKCLDPKLFKNAPFNPKRPTENLEQRRSILYDEVVDPLRQLIEGTGWHAELDEVESTPLVPTTERNPILPNSTDSQDDGNGAVQSATAAKADARWKRDAWLEQIAFVNQRIRDELKRAGRIPRLKIAILDTGYDDNAPTFYVPGRSKRIKRWRDFVANSQKPIDTDGHGTHLVTLLLQVAPSAEIYVARVAENSKALATAEDHISQAIHTAAVDWDVDFVSMSFGFSRHVTKIRQAISDAVYHKRGAITFFAAAANDGFNSREMFPANLGESVISVRGTNRSGAFEPDFNPPTSSDELVFGTLGKDVYSDWIGAESRRSMSGCSVATPVAVGIASMLIDYAASRPAEFPPEDLRLMRTRRGVFELLREIGVSAGGGRAYVAPFDLFSLSEDVRLAKIKAAIGRHPERW